MTGAPKIFRSASAAETIAAGREIAALLRPPKLLILRGELGAGKTTLVKGIAEALDAADADAVTSPTFTLIHEYGGKCGDPPIPVRLYHLDLYRLETEEQLQPLGLEEIAAAQDAIILVEWGEKFSTLRKLCDGEISLTHAGGDTRTIALRLYG